MNVMVFPYDFEFLPVLKNRHLLTDITIKSLVSPSGFGLTGKDGYFFDDDKKSGLTIISQMSKEQFGGIDAVWLTEAIKKLHPEEIREYIKNISQYVKTVIFTFAEDKAFEKGIIGLCELYGIKTITTQDYLLTYNMLDIESITDSLKWRKCETPVITVFGISGMTQKFELQLYLRSQFLNRGYKVSQIGSKSLCETMGFYSIPAFIFSSKYTEIEKVLKLNAFIKEIEERENPDVIIIGIPDGIMPLTQKHHFNFGIPAYEICCAVNPDFTILSLFDGMYNDEFFEEMTRLFKYRFNIDLDVFITSHYTPISNSIDEERLAFTYTKGTKNDSDEFCVYDIKDLENDDVFSHIVKKLSMYAQFQIM
jgi:peptide maturation system protein (TIGR04066 family)